MERARRAPLAWGALGSDHERLTGIRRPVEQGINVRIAVVRLVEFHQLVRHGRVIQVGGCAGHGLEKIVAWPAA